MSKKTIKMLITWAIIIAIIATAIILLITVVNKKKVTPIFETDATGQSLLVYNGKDENVVIPKEIKLIGNSAFEKNSSIVNVSFEKGSKINVIARNAFKSCVNLKNITLPETVTEIGYGAFQDCMRLETINIPASVKTIGQSAFYGCSSLERLELKEGIEKIENNAFASTGLTYMYFPGTLKYLGEGVFTGCNDLEDIDVASDSDIFEHDEEDNVLYYIDNNSKEIVLVLKTEKRDFVVKNDVTKIHSNAFFSADSLETLVIPNSVKEIGIEAFSGCRNLKSITVPFIGTVLDGFKIINGENKYVGQTNFASIFGTVPSTLTSIKITQGTRIIEKAFKDLVNVTSIELPTTIESLDNEAFSGCTKLSKIVNIPTNLTKINQKVFLGCSSLTNSIIVDLLSSSVKIIENEAFSGCSALTNITVPSTVEHIGSGAFKGCSSLQSIILPFIGMGYETNQKDGELKLVNNTKVFNNKTLFGYIFGSTNEADNGSNMPSNLKQVTINGNYDIPSYAFVNCEKLTSIVINNNVKVIGDYAFNGCSNIVNMELPTSLVSLGELAFSNCKELKAIVIPTGVIEIKDKTFMGCRALTNVEMMNVTSLGDKVFDGCPRLSEIKLSETNPNYVFKVEEITVDSKQQQTKALYTKDLSELILYLASSTAKEFAIPTEVKYIHASAFVACNKLSTLVIPSSVEEISSQAIVACDNLSNLTIPFIGNKRVSEIAYFESIFGGSKPENLKVTVLSGTTIEDEAFINVNYLSSIVLSSELKTIGNNAFINCSMLSEVIFNLETNVLETIGNSAFSGCSQISSLTLPSSLKQIGNYAFADCSQINSINIPMSIEYIGIGAFRNWSSLQTLNIEENHPNYILQDGALLSKDGKTLVLYVAGDSKDSYTIPNFVETLNAYAFSGANNLKEVVVPNTILTLPEGLFYNCRNLQTVTLPESTNVIPFKMFERCASLTTVNNANKVTTIEANAFKECKKLVTTPISDMTVEIGENAFEGCTKITEVVIPSAIKEIASSAFKSCTGLVNITFPEGLTKIGDNAFEECSNIANFTLPSTLEVIGKSAFKSCRSSAFTKLVIPESVITIGDNAFDQCIRLVLIYIPETVVNVGSQAFANMAGAKIFTKAIKVNVSQEGAKTYTYPETWAQNCTLASGDVFAKDEFDVVDGLFVIIVNVPKSDDSPEYSYAEITGYMGNETQITINQTYTIAGNTYNATSIAERAFNACKTIISIVIPTTITQVGQNIFEGCTSLTTINCGATSKPEEWDNDWNPTNINTVWGYSD